MTALVPVPGTDLVPDGWCESTVMPWADEQVDGGALKQATAQLAGLIEAYAILNADSLELVKARRYIEVRWGELLGPATKGAHHSAAAEGAVTLSKDERHEFRRLAENRDRVVEAITSATKADDLSRARVLATANGAHVANNSGHIEWYTPELYVNAARKVMGDIDLDPASSLTANKVIKAKKFYSEADDGLSQNWAGRVWMNPPYAGGVIEKFCTKLRDSYIADDITQAVVLVNNATETGWFHSLARVANAFCFPSGRISFWRTDRPSFTPLQGQCFMYFGDRPDVFGATFGAHGIVLRP